jgi:hypothetical protein
MRADRPYGECEYRDGHRVFVHPDEEEAKARGLEAFQYFGFALGHFYVYGRHKPGVTNVWERFQAAKASLPDVARGNGIGTAEQLRERLLAYQDAGVDQVIFVQQAERNKHEHIIGSLRLFASDVMPRLKQDAAERERSKQAELAPYIAAALKRKQWMQPLARDQIPVVEAYGKTVVASKEVTDKPTYRLGRTGGFEVPMEDLAAKNLDTAAE